MGKTILYGVDELNRIHEIHQNNNGMASCFPIWNYLDGQYCQNEVLSFSDRPCWKLTPQNLSDEEYFMLLTSFDGYYFKRDNIEDMLVLLRKTHEREQNPICSTRLEFFEKAYDSDKYNKFFITATTVADYSTFIDYNYDDVLDEFVDLPVLKETVWDIWEEYINDLKKYRIEEK